MQHKRFLVPLKLEITWMKQTLARLSRLVHAFISKPFVFLSPSIPSLVSSSGLLS